MIFSISVLHIHFFLSVPNCVDMLKQLEYITDELDDVISKASYYGCCMDLLLEEGKLCNRHRMHICNLVFILSSHFCHWQL